MQKLFKITGTESLVTRNPVPISFAQENETIKKYSFITVGRLIDSKGCNDISFIDRYIENGLIIGRNPSLINFEQSRYIDNVSNLELPSYYSQSTYYLSMSKTEGSPKALLEAIFSGCIPVITDIPAHVDIIKELGYGFLVKSCEEAIQIMNNHENNYSSEKHQLFIDKWNIKTVVSKEFDFIKKICAEY